MEVSIDKSGRVVIPKRLRERAGIEPGARLNIEFRDGRIEIEPVREPRPPEPSQPTDRQVLDAIRALRDERTRR